MPVIASMLSFLIVNKNPLKNADQDQDAIGKPNRLALIGN